MGNYWSLFFPVKRGPLIWTGELFPEPEKRSQVRHVDKLVKVWRKDGTDEYILVHVEVQGGYDKDFARRMFEYYCRLYVRFKRPVEALAIFTDREGGKTPGHCELVSMVTRMRLDYHTLYLATWEDRVLVYSGNTFALARAGVIGEAEDQGGIFVSEQLCTLCI